MQERSTYPVARVGSSPGVSPGASVRWVRLPSDLWRQTPFLRARSTRRPRAPVGLRRTGADGRPERSRGARPRLRPGAPVHSRCSCWTRRPGMSACSRCALPRLQPGALRPGGGQSGHRVRWSSELLSSRLPEVVARAAGRDASFPRPRAPSAEQSCACAAATWPESDGARPAAGPWARSCRGAPTRPRDEPVAVHRPPSPMRATPRAGRPPPTPPSADAVAGIRPGAAAGNTARHVHENGLRGRARRTGCSARERRPARGIHFPGQPSPGSLPLPTFRFCT
jgi:hypothetical protein